MHRQNPFVDIGCLVRVSDDTPMAAIRQSIVLAARYETRLSVLIAVQTFVAPYTPLWSGMANSIAAEVNEQAQKQGASLAETAEAEAKAAGVEADVQVVAGVFAELGSRAARVARSADLVVVDQQHGALDTSEMLLEEALFRSGRPVLIASPRRAPVEEVRSIVVGWDGSSHAARAVSDALATFPTLGKIEIVTISGEKSLKNILPGADFAQHLARKGVEVVLTDVTVDGRSVAEILDGCAIAAKADLIVTGAFGHSRLREFLLGGVTVDLTEKATTPVLMAY